MTRIRKGLSLSACCALRDFCLAAGFGRMLFLARAMATEARGFLAFTSSQGFEQIVIGQSANFLRPLAKVLECGARKDSAALLQAIERGEGNSVSAIELVKEIKELGFVLVVRAVALFCLGLRRRFGAYSVIRSHRCLSIR